MDRKYSLRLGSGSLTWWLMSGFGAFVLLGSLAMVMYFHHLGRVEEMKELESLGKANALFLDESKLPQSGYMAGQLGRIMAARVEFIDSAAKAADGMAKKEGNQILVGFRLESGKEVWFSRELGGGGAGMVWKRLDARVGLLGFWVMSLALALWLGRKVTVPMGRLAAVLPEIGGEGDLVGLPREGPREIGELSEVLEKTHASLKEERDKRRGAERLALLGRMATSLAHEVRNPVSAIRLHGQLIERTSNGSDKASAAMIVGEAERIEALVNQWMRYAKPGGIKREGVDVVGLLDDVLKGLEAQARHAGALLELEVIGNVGDVVGDGERLRQVFWNLILNAIQSMAGGGRVKVKVCEREIVVEDEGRGLSADALRRYGEPFHSEKEGGMGLGVAVSKEIVEAHGGELCAENREEGGARVRVIWKKN